MLQAIRIRTNRVIRVCPDVVAFSLNDSAVLADAAHVDFDLFFVEVIIRVANRLAVEAHI